MEHYFLAPSSAHIWAAPDGCRAYPALSAAYPDTGGSEHSDEGTACHDIAEHMIRSLASRAVLPDFVGTTANNGVLVDQDMQDGAALYARVAREYMRAANVFGGENIGIESRLSMAHLHPANGGTCDFWLADRKNFKLVGVDFKYGRIPVDAYENWQIVDYLAGVCEKLGLSGIDDQHWTFEVCVVQPRARHVRGPVRTWRGKLSDLRSRWNIMTASAAECFEPNPVARTGPHCQHCEARHDCATFEKAAAAAMEYAENACIEPLTPHAIGRELQMLNRAEDVLKHRKIGLTAQAEQLARGGTLVPGFTLQSVSGRAKWSMADEDVFAVGDVSGVELRKIEPITPTQAKAKGLPPVIVDAYSKRATALKFMPDNDNLAKEVFSR